MNDLLLDITRWLETNNFGTEGSSIFRDYSPDSPDAQICLYEYNSSPFQHDPVADRYVQFVVQDKSSKQAREKALGIYKLLSTIGDGKIQFTEARWCIVALKQSPIKIKMDNQRRVQWAFNTRMTTYNDYI